MGFGAAAETAGRYAAVGPLAVLEDAATHLARIDAGELDGAVIGEALRLVKRIKGATASLEAGLVRAAEKTGLAEAKGERDTVSFLANELQMSPGEAKRTADLGRHLDALPATREALAAGDIGVDQAHQISRAAKRGVLGDHRITEAQLLDTARATTPKQLSDEIRRREAAADGDRLLRDQQRAHSRRSLRTWTTPDGLGHGTWTADPQSHELISAFVDAFTTPDPAGTPIERQRTPEQRRFDGLVQGAAVALGAGEAPTVGKVRPHVNVFVDHDTLVAASADGTRGPDRDLVPAETAQGPICLDTLRRHVCDADVTTFITDGAKVLSVGRTTREWSDAQRKAIVATDGHCRWPGCDAPPAWCQIHHVAWWGRDEGHTDVDNGALLCLRHHILAHEGGWTLTMDAATRRVTVVSPDRRTRLTSDPDGALPSIARRRRRRTA